MSDQVCCSTSLILFPLDAPTGLAATATDTTLALTWGAVTGAVSYTVTWSGGGETGSASVTDPAYTITGLTAGTAYTVSVIAVPDPTSNNEPSRPAVLVTGTTGGDVLPTPTGVAATNLANTSADISWSPVAGAAAYNVSVATSAAPTVPVFTQTGATSPQAVTGLEADTEYIASVVATAPGSTDSAAGTVTFTTTNVALATPAGFANSAVTATSATVTWGAVANATGYTVTTTPATSTYNPTGASVNLTGLTASTEYTVNVVANDSTGEFNDSAAGTTTVTTTA